ncbi:MAG: hypothetical protein QXR31_06180, partial [Zestosphaera sp.]
MSSVVIRKFLDTVSETLEVIDLRGQTEVSPVFMVMSFIVIVLTSFSTSLYVIILTLVTSLAILAITRD